MIKLNELRIGNLVSLTKDGKAIIPLSKKNLCFYLSEPIYSGGKLNCNEANIFPVPLSDDLIKSLGFEDFIESTWRNGGKGFHKKFSPKNFQGYLGEPLNIYDGADSNIENDGCYMIGVRQFNIAKIKYVHELQNIYFVLSGEDLICEIETAQ